MIELLSKLGYHDLYQAAGMDKINALQKLVNIKGDDTDFDSSKLSKQVLAIYGYDLLYEQKIRHLIFTLINEVTLKKLALKYSKKVYDKPYDNALVLSLHPWKAGSQLISEVVKELCIPKEYLPLKTNVNQTIEIVEPIDPLFDLQPFQKQLKDKILNNMSSDTRRFLVQMPTGSGKTRTVIESIYEYICSENTFTNQESILWVAHTEELCEQAIDTFKDIWQNYANQPAQIVRCWGTYQPISLDCIGSFIVATFQKLNILSQKNPEIFTFLQKSVRIVVVDEAHKVIAPTYERVINKLSKNSILIGITATPGRSYSKSKENLNLAKYFEKNLVSLNFTENPITELRNKGVLSTICRKIIETEVKVSIERDDREEMADSYDLPSRIIKTLANNVARNRIILDIICNELQNGNPCLVFSCSIEHSRLLSAAIGYRGCNSGYVDCNMRKGSRKRIISGFKKGEYDVLFNYGVLTTGFDAPRIKSVIIARPTASIVLYSQMIGRGLRGPLMGGTEKCNVIDIKDNYLNFGGVEDVYSFFEEYWQ